MLLICEIKFPPKAKLAPSQTLQKLDLQSLCTNDESMQSNKPGKLALLTSQLLCGSLYGSLTEKEVGDSRHYSASFIVDSQGNMDREGDV